jgi:Tfp pilus assembly protein PilW
MKFKRTHHGRFARGFTLVEILISLLSGLIVAMGVMGLSRVATNTFHEETRASSTELALRVASERLRADLARAAYMSTTNILTDPQVSKPKGSGVVTPDVTFKSLGTLAGIAFSSKGSVNGTDAITVSVKTLSAENGLSPDSILLGGNFTTADEYIVQSILTTSTGGCGGQTITLSSDSAAILRQTVKANGQPKPQAEAEAAIGDAFQPVVAADGKGQFMARLVDDSGHTQFVALCDTRATMLSVTSGGGAPTIQLHVPPTSKILTAFDTGGSGGTTGFAVGRLTVNPVQLIRWSVRRVANPRLDPGVAELDAAKFDLFRSWVDVLGNEVRSELIAEYVVDLSFAFGRNQTGNNFVASDFGDASPFAMPLTYPVGGAQPEQLRTVRYRLSLRTATADRKEPIAAPAGGFVYRYCITQGGCADTKAFARVRTLIHEVSLPNQIR